MMRFEPAFVVGKFAVYTPPCGWEVYEKTGPNTGSFSAEFHDLTKAKQYAVKLAVING